MFDREGDPNWMSPFDKFMFAAPAIFGIIAAIGFGIADLFK